MSPTAETLWPFTSSVSYGPGLALGPANNPATERIIMEIWMGRDGLDKSKQEPFPAETHCVHCDAIAEVAFVAYEQVSPEGKTPDYPLCRMRPHEPDKLWPHDLCAFAVYLCRNCLESTALFNQS